VRDVVFEMVLLKVKLGGVNFERLRQQRTQIPHFFFALAEANEIQNLGGIRKRVLNFFRKIGVAVLAHGDVVDVRNLCADGIETRFDRQRGEAGVVLAAVQTFFGNGKSYFAIVENRRGGVGMKHV
jgi:hypothetical protein